MHNDLQGRESAARADFELRAGRKLTDVEWMAVRERLLNFVRILVLGIEPRSIRKQVKLKGYASQNLNCDAGPKGQAATHANHAVLYARVSSKDQEREGYSIPAQERAIRDYAIQRGLVIVEQFVDVETAKRSGRTAFTAMLEYLKKHRATCRTILVEKTDRLYHNLKDWTTLDDLGATIHLVKEGRVIGPDSRSSDHLAHGINVLMARNYILNLGEETRKGMTEKARAGIYPSCAPVGYRNVIGPNGKRTIAPDPVSAPVVTDIFERFAAGTHSARSLVKQMNAEGVQLRGHRLHSSLVHQILRKRLYTGDFDWDGITYTGIYEPLVTRECWHRVQQLLDARAENRTR